MTKNLYNLSQNNSLITTWVNELRDVETQKDSMRFRRNLERIAEIGAYEISKKLSYQSITTITPLGKHNSQKLENQPVVLTILRAGIPMFQGVLNYFDRAKSGFIGAYRQHSGNTEFSINQSYVTSPIIDKLPLIITDPMLATGASLVEALKSIKEIGEPSQIHILSAIAAKQGIGFVFKNFPNTHIWCGTIDEELNEYGYIVPGLGDAGDLSFGEKTQN